MSSIIDSISYTHSSLDLFQKKALLVNFDDGVTQDIYPTTSVNGPTLEFSIEGDQSHYIDLRQTYLKISAQVVKGDGTPMTWDAADVALQNKAYFVNNVAHSLFQNFELTANGVMISNGNGLYNHQAYVGTELSHTLACKSNILSTAGYYYERNPSETDGTAAGVGSGQYTRLLQCRESGVCNFITPLSIDFFTCDKLILPHVELRLKLVRAADSFCIISNDAGVTYSAKVIDAQLIVRKLKVADNVHLAIHKTLQSSPAQYHFLETVTRTYVVPANQSNFNKEAIMGNEPVRRLAIAIAPNASFSGSQTTNPFSYTRNGLKRIALIWSGIPVIDMKVSADDLVYPYFLSQKALGMDHAGNGINLADYPNHFIMVFDLTSTREAGSDVIYPELTGASIRLKLEFDAAITTPLEIFVMGEKDGTVYIDKNKTVVKQ
jgi:hypothetical protein